MPGQHHVTEMLPCLRVGPAPDSLRIYLAPSFNLCLEGLSRQVRFPV